jgi:hypothetical protein
MTSRALSNVWIDLVDDCYKHGDPYQAGRILESRWELIKECLESMGVYKVHEEEE